MFFFSLFVACSSVSLRNLGTAKMKIEVEITKNFRFLFTKNKQSLIDIIDIIAAMRHI